MRLWNRATLQSEQMRKKYAKMEPTWKLTSIKNTKHRSTERFECKMVARMDPGAMQKHIQILQTWSINESKMHSNAAKYPTNLSTERFRCKMVTRTVRRGSPYFGVVPFWSPFGAEMVPRRPPVGPLGRRLWLPKSRKRDVPKHLKINAVKVLKITVKWHGNCGQMHGKINKFTQLFGRGTNAKKH